MDDSGTILGYLTRLVAVLLLVLANGFFVAAEFALVGVRRPRIETLAAGGSRRARRLLGLLDQLNAYLSASQLGITLASLALGWIGEPAIARLLEAPLAGRVSDSARHAIAFALGFTIITTLHIVLGEQAPKLLGLERAERVALAIAWPMQTFYRLFRWPIRALDWASAHAVRLVGLHPTAAHASIYTEEELRHVIELSHKGGELEANRRALLSRTLEFSNLTARYAMIPRTEVEAVSDAMSLEEIVARIRESGYSRIPVYHETLDNIIGIVYSKEILTFWDDRAGFSLASIMHPANFVPDTMRLDAVLRRMQEERFHFAVVTDEHGGMEGIITLEDLLEEIVGEIQDEFDDEAQQLVQRRKDGSYLLDGALPVRSANRRLSLGLPEETIYHTIAGFLMARAGRVLREGDRVEYGDAEFLVERADRHRIRAVRLTLKNHLKPNPGLSAHKV
jgi:CBS domain containing-hemolysin-like protein